MKRILALLLAMLMLVLPAMAENEFKFTTVDMDGNEVTEAIFADYDVTLVFVWATWCGYCVYEMPVFAQLKERLPEKVNIISICTDAADDPEAVEEILASANANYPTLHASDELYNGLLRYAYAFPTALFVDNEGKPIGQPIIGLPSMDLEEAMNAYYQAIMLRLNIIK